MELKRSDWVMVETALRRLAYFCFYISHANSIIQYQNPSKVQGKEVTIIYEKRMVLPVEPRKLDSLQSKRLLLLFISHSVVPDSLRPHGLQPTRLLCPWDSPGKDTGVGRHFLLQGIFPTWGLNPGLPHCRQMLYRLSYQERCHCSLLLTQLPNSAQAGTFVSSF